MNKSNLKKAIVIYSDGSSEKMNIKETALPQEIKISKRNTFWVKFTDLKENENKLCLWIEVEIWGPDQDLNLTGN